MHGGVPVRATLAGVLLFVIGMAIAGSTIITEWRDRERREGWVKANGTVVDVLPGPPDGSPRPVVAFDTAEGERVRFTPTGRSTWQALKVGDAVPVLYPFALPGLARIDPRSIRWVRIGIALGARPGADGARRLRRAGTRSAGMPARRSAVE